MVNTVSDGTLVPAGTAQALWGCQQWDLQDGLGPIVTCISN